MSRMVKVRGSELQKKNFRFSMSDVCSFVSSLSFFFFFFLLLYFFFLGLVLLLLVSGGFVGSAQDGRVALITSFLTFS